MGLANKPEITYYLAKGNKGERRVFRTVVSLPGHLLLLSPHKNSESAIYIFDDIKKYLERIKKKTADVILGEQFRGVSEKWMYNGKEYRVSANYDVDLYHEVPCHHDIYRIGWYRGKLYWFCIYVNSFNNSCVKYPLENIDTPPRVGYNGSWAQLHNFKPVYCKDTKSYI